MKILHIIDSLGLGGAQTVVKGIFEKQKDNKNIFLYALRKKDIKIEINHKNVKIFNSGKKYSLAPIKELKKIIETEKINILHCHLPKSQYFGYLLKKKYFPRIRLIFHEHGDIFDSKIAVPIMLKKTKKYVNLFIAVSKATKQKLIEKAKVNPGKIKVLYNFVDLDKFNRKNIKINVNKEKEKLGIKKDEFVVGFAGRLIKRKGWREFIEAAREIVKKNDKIKFLIAGNGPDKKRVLKLIKKYNLREEVLYRGYVKNMVQFYSLLDLFVIPSHWEPMGLTELEAQAMEIPIIVSNVPGLNEVVNDRKNCLLIKPKNLMDLLEKITKLFTDWNLRKNLANKGLKNIKTYFLKNYIKKLNKFYRVFS